MKKILLIILFPCLYFLAFLLFSSLISQFIGVPLGKYGKTHLPFPVLICEFVSNNGPQTQAVETCIRNWTGIALNLFLFISIYSLYLKKVIK